MKNDTLLYQVATTSNLVIIDSSEDARLSFFDCQCYPTQTVNIRARQPFSERLPNPAFYQQQQNMFAEERSAIDSNSLDLDYAGVDGDDDLALATGRGFYIPPGEFSIFDAVPY
jgi:hypothetical protein